MRPGTDELVLGVPCRSSPARVWLVLALLSVPWSEPFDAASAVERLATRDWVENDGDGRPDAWHRGVSATGCRAVRVCMMIRAVMDRVPRKRCYDLWCIAMYPADLLVTRLRVLHTRKPISCFARRSLLWQVGQAKAGSQLAHLCLHALCALGGLTSPTPCYVQPAPPCCCRVPP